MIRVHRVCVVESGRKGPSADHCVYTISLARPLSTALHCVAQTHAAALDHLGVDPQIGPVLGEVRAEQPGYVQVRLLARAAPRVGVDALAADLVRVRARVRVRLGLGLG